MISRTLWEGRVVPALGLGCWAIGGPFSTPDGGPSGWGAVDDAESLRALAAGIEAGIRLFDTAQAYGAGHSEALLGRALERHPDAVVVTKVGWAIDEGRRQFVGPEADAAAMAASVEGSLRRLRRERVDLVLLHLNEADPALAGEAFDALDALRAAGKVGAYGWSTDFPDRAGAHAGREGFVAVEHAMNVLFRADRLTPVLEAHGLLALVRSPLAMGLLGGRYDAASRIAPDDVRSRSAAWMDWFKDGRVAPDMLDRLAAVGDLLATGGRTMVQGALGWLWARSLGTIPIPGFRTEAQVREIAGALEHGPLPPEVMAEVERALDRPDEGEPRSR